MNSPSITHGVVCALWTPLTGAGQPDFPALDRHLEWLATTGIDGLLVLGSTGRFPALPVTVREALIRHVLKQASPLSCLVNISDLDQPAVARLGRVAKESGAGGAAIMAPWFYEQAQADLIEWFVGAGRAADLPLWLYNFPERTGNCIDLGTVKEVMAQVPVGGFKNSGANQELLRELAKLARTSPFAVFAGADAHIPEVLALGAVGCIGGLANAVPEAMVRVYQAAAAGNPHEASPEQELLLEVERRLRLVPFPWNVAAVMAARGLPVGALPATMSRVTHAHYEQLKSEIQGVFREHGLACF
jgi:dihydrodipicolinate synthase/N-acetylneuraminate lyase